MRQIHKSWQDKRSGWTRRVRWYEGLDDIRLNFEDETGSVNRYYKTKDSAQADYDNFRQGNASVPQLRILPGK
jgi:hypothetical protein